MKRSALFKGIALIIFCSAIHPFTFSQAQQTRRFFFPDIPGYKTLKCDFHSHTLISDGNVEPVFRVKEAWQDGLDVISITDHIDRPPAVKIDSMGIMAWYQEAYAMAKKLGIVLIPGAELTKKMPVGHFNLLFIRAFGSVKDGKFMDVLEEARKQSAFVIWNHPGWKHIFRIPVWHHTQTDIYNKGLMNGIEIVNYKSHYPLSQHWAVKKHLTVFANSDIHETTVEKFKTEEGGHRPMTLVFAKDTSLKSIKEALLAGRTLAFNGNKLYGNDTLLQSLFYASVNFETTIPAQLVTNGRKKVILTLTNHSCMHYKLKLRKHIKGLTAPRTIDLKADTVFEAAMYNKNYGKNAGKKTALKYKVMNMRRSYCKKIKVEIRVAL